MYPYTRPLTQIDNKPRENLYGAAGEFRSRYHLLDREVLFRLSYSSIIKVLVLAGRLGFGPWSKDLESSVLPLHHQPPKEHRAGSEARTSERVPRPVVSHVL